MSHGKSPELNRSLVGLQKSARLPLQATNHVFTATVLTKVQGIVPCSGGPLNAMLQAEKAQGAVNKLSSSIRMQTSDRETEGPQGRHHLHDRFSSGRGVLGRKCHKEGDVDHRHGPQRLIPPLLIPLNIALRRCSFWGDTATGEATTSGSSMGGPECTRESPASNGSSPPNKSGRLSSKGSVRGSAAGPPTVSDTATSVGMAFGSCGNDAPDTTAPDDCDNDVPEDAACGNDAP